MGLQELVPHARAADQAGESAFACLAHAEQPHHVAAIAVESEQLIRAIASDTGAQLDSLVVDVAQHVAVRILRHRRAEIAPYPPEHRAHLFVAETLSRQPLYQQKTAPVIDLLRPALDGGRQAPERKITDRNLRHLEAAVEALSSGCSQLFHLGR
jgi:hypothetical protein